MVMLAASAVSVTWYLTRDSGEDDTDVLPPAPGLTGEFHTGAQVPLAEQSVGSDGGTVVAADGLTIEVPSGAHPSNVTYAVVSSPITGHTFGETIRPASALYSIDNGGGYTGELITLDIPVTVPEGGFAMGFFYDAATGRLEGMPILALDADSVTVATRHFSDLVVLEFPGLGIATIPDFVADSNFRPGTDDWQFRNLGSYAAPNGHCSGQSLSALWYYLEQRREAGASPLNGLFDNNGGTATPGLWEDDSDGYRLASAVQADEHSTVSLAERIFENITRSRADPLQYLALAATITTTGEPQYVGIYDTAQGGGHAMIAYKVDRRGIWVADPNYPGEERLIPYDGLNLGPYRSGNKANEAPKDFDAIGYFGTTALINWQGLGGRWTEFQSGTVGTDVFRDVGLEITRVVAKDDGTLEDVTVINSMTIPLGEQIDFDVIGQDDLPLNDDYRLSVYEMDGLLEVGRDNASVTVQLDAGTHDLGFYVEGSPAGTNWMFVDFQRFSIVVGAGIAINVTPAVLSGPPDSDVPVTISVISQLTSDLNDVEVRVDGAPGCNARLGLLTPTGALEHTCTVLVPGSGSREHTVEVFGWSADGARVAATATVTATAQAGPATLYLSVEPIQQTGRPGGTVSFTVTVTGPAEVGVSGELSLDSGITCDATMFALEPGGAFTTTCAHTLAEDPGTVELYFGAYGTTDLGVEVSVDSSATVVVEPPSYGEPQLLLDHMGDIDGDSIDAVGLPYLEVGPVTVPSDGLITTETAGYRMDGGVPLDPDTHWCGDGGGVRWFPTGPNGEELWTFPGDFGYTDFPVQEGTMVWAHADGCGSTGGGYYPYRHEIKLWFRPLLGS